MSIDANADLEDETVGGCEHVDFSDDDPARCGRDAHRVEVGNVTTRLCDEHAAKARQEREA